MTWTDPDFGPIYSRAAAKGDAARVTDAQSQVSATAGKLAGAADGSQPEKLAADASEVGKTLSSLATDAALTTSIWGDLKAAADAWKAAAPKAEELNAAEKAVTDAVAASTTANEKADAAGATQADHDAADKAGDAAIAAKNKLIELKRKRTEANKAFREAVGRAIAKAKGITCWEKADAPSGGYGNGKGKPETGPTTGTAGSGAPAGKPTTTGSGTPAATPGAKAPGTTAPTGTTPETKTSGTTTDPSALLSALSRQSQQPQQAQGTPAATQPAAAAQQQPQAQQGKQDGKGNEKHSLATDGVLGDEDIARLTGEAGAAGAGLGIGAAGLGASLANAGNGITTQYRAPGTPIQGTAPGGTPATPAPAPTTGTSRTDLVTNAGNTEVGGRSDAPRTAFSEPAAQTKLSSADPTGLNPKGTTAAAGNPMGGMNPMMHPLSAPAPTQARGKNSDGDRDKITTYGENGLLHGADTLAEAVPGGTICQNRPGRGAA